MNAEPVAKAAGFFAAMMKPCGEINRPKAAPRR